MRVVQEVSHRVSPEEESVESLQSQLREVRQRLAFFQDAGNTFQRRLDDIVDAAVQTVEHVETERQELEIEVDGLRHELADLQQTLDHSQAQTESILDQAREDARQLVEEAKTRTLDAIRLALQHLDGAQSPSISFSSPAAEVTAIAAPVEEEPPAQLFNSEESNPRPALTLVEQSTGEDESEHVGEFAPLAQPTMEAATTATPMPAPALVHADDDGVTFESITRLHIRAGGDSHTD